MHFANNARTMYYVMDAVYVHCTSVEKPCFHQRQQHTNSQPGLCATYKQPATASARQCLAVVCGGGEICSVFSIATLGMMHVEVVWLLSTNSCALYGWLRAFGKAKMTFFTCFVTSVALVLVQSRLCSKMIKHVP